VDVDRESIRVDRDRAVAVGAEDLGAGGAIAIEHVRRGVAEIISAPHAHDGGSRRDRAHKVASTGCEAAVVRHLHDPQPRRRYRGGQHAFRLLADVAGQQHRDVAPAKFDHDRIVVADALALPVRGPRMPHDDLNIVHYDAIADRHVRPLEAERVRLVAQRPQRLEARHRNAFPHFTRPELAQHGGGAANVIRIAVGQRDVTQAAEAGVAQDGRDHAIADVERRRG